MAGELRERGVELEMGLNLNLNLNLSLGLGLGSGSGSDSDLDLARNLERWREQEREKERREKKRVLTDEQMADLSCFIIDGLYGLILTDENGDNFILAAVKEAVCEFVRFLADLLGHMKTISCSLFSKAPKAIRRAVEYMDTSTVTMAMASQLLSPQR